MNIYETIGVGFVITATICFTGALLYFGIQGALVIQRRINKGMEVEAREMETAR